MVKSTVAAAVAAALLAVFAAGTTLVAADNEVKVTSYDYDGSTLSGKITLLNIAYEKLVTVYYADLAQNFGYSCAAGYDNGPNATNYEFWTFACSIGPAGVSQFYVQYNVSGQSYYDSNGGFGANYPVTQPTSTATTTASPWTTPTATTTVGATATATGGPIGKLSADVTDWLATVTPLAREKLLANIHPNGTIPGIVVAAVRDQPTGQNYFFHWIRDASLVMEVVRKWYATSGNETLRDLFFSHRDLTHKLQNINALTGLGEAKFNVDGSDYTGGWCRPQNDGPAFRASVFMRFARDYLSRGGDNKTVLALWNDAASGVIKADLEYVSKNLNDGSGCDLWEERRGLHFFTMMAQRRALLEGADFARTVVADPGAGDYYALQAAAAEARLSASFFSVAKGLMVTTLNGRQLDSALPLGVLHGYNGDGFYAPTDERVLASLYAFAGGFVAEYALNNQSLVDSATGLPLSYAIGRYYGDTYDGLGNTGGNPWFLCTLAFAELYYRAARQYVERGQLTVSALGLPFWTGARPAGAGVGGVELVAGTAYAAGTAEFRAAVSALVDLADTYVRRVKVHAKAVPAFGLNEQYRRNNGTPTGVDDLTWSYAALTTAAEARQALVSAGYFSDGTGEDDDDGDGDGDGSGSVYGPGSSGGGGGNGGYGGGSSGSGGGGDGGAWYHPSHPCDTKKA